MKGILYGIGLGPGDPGLLTLKAVEALNESDVIFIPRGIRTTASAAGNIVDRALKSGRFNLNEEKVPVIRELVYRMDGDPLKRSVFWREQAENMTGLLNRGQIISYVTLGDVCFYSTFGYLQSALTSLGTWDIRRIPGISSFQLASAALGRDLVSGSERLGVYPLPENLDRLTDILSIHETVVVMKIGGRLAEFRLWLRKRNLESSASFVRRVGFPDEKLAPSLAELPEGESGGLSLVIIDTNKLQ